MSTTDTYPTGSPLLRHALGLHLTGGVAGIIVVGLAMKYSGALSHWPLLVLLVLIPAGLWALNRRLATFAEIDRRLLQFAHCAHFDPQSLSKLSGSDRTAEGWNRLVESACVQQLLNRADAVVAQAHPASADVKTDGLLDALTDGLIVADADGNRQWQNSMAGTLLPDGCDADGEPGLLKLHELFRGFLNFDTQIGLLTDRTTLAPYAFEMQRGEAISEGVLRVQRQCLSERHETFLWTIRDVTQQRLAIEMRDCFVSAATHELRTPLANIRAYAETLIDSHEINPEEERQFLNVILAEAGRLDRTIDGLLNISRMQAGGMTLDRHETQVDRMVTEIRETIRPLFDKKTLAFETIVPPRLPELYVDKTKLEAALVNLLGNAIKYTPDGGRVVLEAEYEGNEVRFHVEDTGIGIAESEIPRLFERFFRSSDPRVDEIQGTGLGLAFAQDVARLHGGRIEVASELNKGSRFSLILPASLAKSGPNLAR